MTMEQAFTPEQSLVDRLIEKKWHIAFAESCTGGLAAAKLVGVADASRVLDASLVTYANEAKIRYLGVSPESIDCFGVVSQQVAMEMARGVALENEAQVGVGISGIAGPSGGTAEKPVGTVCFGFYVNGKNYGVTQHFGDLGRNQVRVAAVDFVYAALLKLLD